MKKHAKKCWGAETVAQSLQSNIDGVRKAVGLQKNGSIPLAFAPKGRGVVTYSTRPMTPLDVR